MDNLPLIFFSLASHSGSHILFQTIFYCLLLCSLLHVCEGRSIMVKHSLCNIPTVKIQKEFAG
ncbi:hypothetical protein BACCOP_01444 [Phocaeicola coprocola DSM 17136]|uniref:Uncharacterized protein n=1 Tax=Phocaeicola coprocola DSM 17136 TaxID=470145 RepID=B3JHT2_9BACT|nr:hypothetical protein BACCOP_01444 [Phocaeicola coprocola DSM 17136]